MIRFNITAPLGFHVHLASTTHFVFGDEEKVMAELTKVGLYNELRYLITLIEYVLWFGTKYFVLTAVRS